jgi:lysophospholipase L1-like esterase
MKKPAVIAIWLCLSFSIPTRNKITIWLIGDSTMSIKDTKAYPETGWGMPFAFFWDSSVHVENKAMNGRSTRTFLDEKRWDAIVNQLKEGDYVFIQFGHNDEVPSKKSYVPEKDFRTNLVKCVSETRDRKANPILITPVARRKFDSTGHIQETHSVYAQLVRDVAHEYQVPLIDLDELSKTYFQSLGPETSKLLFNYLLPGEHPNYPDGKQDDTHFSELGARKIAEIVLREIRDQKLELADRIIQPIVKN